MAKIPMEYAGGLNKTTSWSDATSKANKYIIILCKGTANGLSRGLSLTIPKDYFSSTYAFTTGHYSTASDNSSLIFKPSNEAKYVYYNGSDVTSSFVFEYYYD